MSKKNLPNVVMDCGGGLKLSLEYDKTLSEIKRENKERIAV